MKEDYSINIKRKLIDNYTEGIIIIRYINYIFMKYLIPLIWLL